MSADPIIEARADNFVAACRTRAAAQHGHLAFPAGIVSGERSVSVAAGKGEPWALGAMRFAAMVQSASLPF